jgi:hypothetical protein
VSKKTDPTPDPSPAADSFTLPSAGDAFSAPTEEQSVVLWSELRELLSGLVDKAATAVDREAADSILRRLGLAVELNPLFLVAIRESKELEAVVKAGVGMAAEAERIRREIQSYLNLSAADPATNQQNATAQDRLTAQHTVAMRAADAASKAERQLRHAKLWLWQLFTPEANPFPEVKNALGETIKQNRGALSTTIVGPQLDAVAREMGIDPFCVDSWRDFRRPEVQPARRRYRTSSPPAVSAMGQTHYPSRF